MSTKYSVEDVDEFVDTVRPEVEPTIIEFTRKDRVPTYTEDVKEDNVLTHLVDHENCEYEFKQIPVFAIKQLKNKHVLNET